MERGWKDGALNQPRSKERVERPKEKKKLMKKLEYFLFLKWGKRVGNEKIIDISDVIQREIFPSRITYPA